MNDVTTILQAMGNGDQSSSEQLLPLVYDELKKLAQQQLRLEPPGQTLSATGLVHEAFLRLVGSTEQSKWDSVGHFYAAAAIAMRRILVDIARKKKTEKHGGKFRRVDLDTVTQTCDTWDADWAESLLELQSALEHFTEAFPNLAEIVNLRYFAGLSMVDISNITGQSLRSTHRNWAFARAWLFKKINDK